MASGEFGSMVVVVSSPGCVPGTVVPVVWVDPPAAVVAGRAVVVGAAVVGAAVVGAAVVGGAVVGAAVVEGCVDPDWAAAGALNAEATIEAAASTATTRRRVTMEEAEPTRLSRAGMRTDFHRQVSIGT